MADLPENRVSGCQVFGIMAWISAVFYYNPKIRHNAPVKFYTFTILHENTFICFVTKVVHLDLISRFTSSLDKDLSTSAFWQALNIWFDNATNFVGDKNELKELIQLFIFC